MTNLFKLLFVMILLLNSCASTNTTNNSKDSTKEVSKPRPTSVQEYLKTIPGLTVTPTKLIVANGEPLIIVDGNRMDYQTLLNMVPVGSIKSARLSRSVTDIKLYDSTLKHTGVLFIKTI